MDAALWRDVYDHALPLDAPGAWIRAAILRELERDIYEETVTATGINPLHDHCTACES